MHKFTIRKRRHIWAMGQLLTIYQHLAVCKKRLNLVSMRKICKFVDDKNSFYAE
jgi:hypothetical protein